MVTFGDIVTHFRPAANTSATQNARARRAVAHMGGAHENFFYLFTVEKMIFLLYTSVGCPCNPQPKILVLFVEKLCFSTTRGLDRGAEAPRGVRFAEMNSANRGWDLSPKNS
ncbi:MAG: hypothetical protein LBF64_03375, partial [Oscillospiraceae bacterium]|nr:hypothetical protein [Oscillospiraceae bacterium]